MRFLFLGLFFVSTLAHAAREGGDFSGTGGGSGVACFANATIANQADTYLAKGQPLPPALFAQAKIQVLERWEMEQGKIPVRPFESQDWQVILKEVKGTLREASPLFAARMEMAADWMNFASWEEAGALNRLPDANPQSPLPSECKLIQLALRYSNGNNVKGAGPVAHQIQLKVVLDKRAFAALDPVDQAMLVLHEQFYAMGQSVGHPDSDMMRNFVRMLFNAEAPKWKLSNQGGIYLIPETFFLQQKLIENFGDYILFFTELDSVDGGVPYSAQHHFATFVSVVKQIQVIDKPCRGKQPLKVCWIQTMDTVLGKTDFSEEESFILLAYFLWHQTARKLNAESVMDPLRNPKQLANAMEHACALMSRDKVRFKNTVTQDKAIQYCATWFQNN